MDLIAPLIPSGQDSKGPELFAQSLGQGLQAVARLSQMRRDSEMEMLKLAEHERLAQEQNVLEREKMSQDFEIRQATLESASELNSAHADYYKAGAKAYTEGTKTGAQRATKRLEQEQALAAEISEHARELKLDDPMFATKEPIQFAANVLQFEDSWRQSPLPWVQGAIKKYRTEADQQKFSLKEIDADGAVTGEAKRVPYWQVVKNLQDPDTKERTMQMLRANGHLKEEVKKTPGTATQSWARPIDSAWDAIMGPTEKSEVVEKDSPQLEGIRKKGEGVEFKRVPSRVPPVAAPRSAYDTLPDPDLPEAMPDGFSQPQTSAPQFEETETDRYIQQAKTAISRGASKEAVAKRLQELGVNPQVLQE